MIDIDKWAIATAIVLALALVIALAEHYGPTGTERRIAKAALGWCLSETSDLNQCLDGHNGEH